MAGRPRKSNALFRWLKQFIHRHWRRLLSLRQRFRITEEAVNLLLAAAVGVVGGLINVAYYFMQVGTKMLVHHQPGDMGEIAAGLEPWQRLLTPTIGGIVAGSILYFGLRYLKSRQSSNLLEVVVAGDGRLPMREGLVKGFSSLVSITSGASIGREGLVTQLSATIASKWGQLWKWQPYRLRLLVGCGASAGISAAYNAPITGAVFAAQIVLGNFSMNLFAPLVCSSVVATVICRSYLGIIQWYSVPDYDFTRLIELPWFLLLGLASGLLGGGFLKVLRGTSQFFQELPIKLPLRLGLAGLLVGVLAVFYPDVWGNGYGATTQLLNESYELHFLLGLTLAKLIATAATVGSGAVGGVMTPTLFLGAGLGSALGVAIHVAGLGTQLPTGAFALVGMGAMLAATTHSALLAMIMVFELSLNYSLMPPLMLACAVATLVSRRIHPDSVYTEPLKDKHALVDRESEALGAATRLTVSDLMQEPVKPLRENTRFEEIANSFLTSPYNNLPVIDADGHLLGMLVLQDLKEYLSMGPELNAVIAYDVMRPVPISLVPGQTILSAIPQIMNADLRNIPVVNNRKQMKLIGRVERSQALGMLSEALATSRSSSS